MYEEKHWCEWHWNEQQHDSQIVHLHSCFCCSHFQLKHSSLSIRKVLHLRQVANYQILRFYYTTLKIKIVTDTKSSKLAFFFLSSLKHANEFWTVFCYHLVVKISYLEDLKSLKCSIKKCLMYASCRKSEKQKQISTD